MLAVTRTVIDIYIIGCVRGLNRGRLSPPPFHLALVMQSPLDYSSLWRRMSMRQIIDILPVETFSSREKRSRASLDEAVLRLPSDQRDVLDHAAYAKAFWIEHPIVEERDNEETMISTEYVSFMETVSEECRQDHICKFIDATGSTATATSTCAVCAGSFFKLEIEEVSVTDLQEKQLLLPAKPHPAQVLTEGMLLHSTPSSIHTSVDGSLMANVCTSCSSDLKRNKTPSFSLANGMWIGDIPLELKVLTLPEKKLGGGGV